MALTESEKQKLMTREEAAAYLRVTVQTLSKYIKQNWFRPKRLGERRVYFTQEDLDLYIQVRNIGAHVKRRLNKEIAIVKVIGEHVPLQRVAPKDSHIPSGCYVGQCPFHQEDGIFVVDPKAKAFACSSCGVRGDTYGFLALHQNMSYPQAVAHLAEQFAVNIFKEVS